MPERGPVRARERARESQREPERTRESQRKRGSGQKFVANFFGLLSGSLCLAAWLYLTHFGSLYLTVGLNFAYRPQLSSAPLTHFILVGGGEEEGGPGNVFWQ